MVNVKCNPVDGAMYAFALIKFSNNFWYFGFSVNLEVIWLRSCLDFSLKYFLGK